MPSQAVGATPVSVPRGAIGVFDSGLGGLTVVQALVDLLPEQDLVYVGDTARYPYGTRTPEQLRAFSDEIADWLVARGVKMLVVACNSATAAALDHLRDRLDVPVVGVVEPGVRAAVAASSTGRVGVIGTAATVGSRLYELTAERLGTGLQLVTRACPELVDLVESGTTRGAEATRVTAAALAGLPADLDALVLGCTHFPLLGRTLSEVVGPGVVLVSSADETAFEVRDLLARTGLDRALRTPGEVPGTVRGRHVFLTSGDPDRFARLGARFLGRSLGHVGRWSADDPPVPTT